MADCAFCNSLELAKESAKRLNDLSDIGKEDPMMYEYTVALVSHYWTEKRGRENAGRTVDYRYQGKGYNLNYCPECGKDLRRADNG